MQLAFLESEGSPIRRQYLALKRQYPDAILFFQLGDFYETFEQDARTVAEECDVALTSREMGRGERVPMAGVPVHAAETYIGRLVERGYHIALCQQVESSSVATAKGSLVRREVTRVITPGTVVDAALLQSTRANYLAALITEGQRTGLAYADISTGEFACAELTGPSQRELARGELWRIEASECLLVEEESARDIVPTSTSLTTDRSLFSDPSSTLRAQFGVASIDALGLGGADLAARAAAAILRYVSRTQAPAGRLLDHLRLYDPLGHMVLDPITRDHLELVRTSRGRKEGSLLHALDRTRTAMGARLLAQWLGHPLLDRAAIEARLDVVQAYLLEGAIAQGVAAQLAETPDLERLTGRLSQRLLMPREALALAQAAERAEILGQTLRQAGEPALTAYADRLALPADLAARIRDRVADDPPFFGEGVIRPGQSAELDELRAGSTDGRQWLLDLERRERERTGAKALKVGYNRVFGYYLEISASALAQPLDHYRRQEMGVETLGQLLEQLGYQRRQTVANAERFVLTELREYETRQDRSRARMADLERHLFDELIEEILAHGPTLSRVAATLAELDVLLA
ncbi:MAG TPA: DNA mismatch repair protein MutS, partial [Chloroflexota bacterium]